MRVEQRQEFLRDVRVDPEDYEYARRLLERYDALDVAHMIGVPT